MGAFATTLAAATGFWSRTEKVSWAEASETDDISEEMPRVLVLSDALPGPNVELPTVGSAGHFTGTCKPCAFFYTRGCQNGFQCSFCHLCPPEEKRRRQKEKQAAFRDARRQRRQIHL